MKRAVTCMLGMKKWIGAIVLAIVLIQSQVVSAAPLSVIADLQKAAGE